MPKKYYYFLKIFSKTKSDYLAFYYKDINLKITLKSDLSPNNLSFSLLYKISPKKLDIIYKYIIKNLNKSFIKPNGVP